MPEGMPVPGALLQLRNISARSRVGTGIHAVSLEVASGTVHGVFGENLSGASEMLAVCGGYIPAADGQIEIDGRAVRFARPRDAEALGVAVVKDEPSVVPHLSIAENVYLGHEESRGGLMRFSRLYASAADLLEKLELSDVRVARPASELTPGERRVVEFARAMAAGRRLLLVDEPFAGLDARERSVVACGIAGLSRAGIAVVVATHRIDMLRRVADTVTVLSRGSAVQTLSRSALADASDAVLIASLAERIEVTSPTKREPLESRRVALELRDWSVFHPLHLDLPVVRDVTLSVGVGEIVGLAGLQGSGVPELTLSIFGRSYGSAARGDLLLDGERIAPASPAQSIAQGLSLSTQAGTLYDLGLIGGIPSGVTPSALARLARLGLIDRGREYRARTPVLGLGGISELIGRRARVEAAGGHRDALRFWLEQPADARPKVVILDHPTRGVGAEEAQETRNSIVRLAAAGTGVLLVSAQLDELLTLASRVYTMAEGRVTSNVPSAGTSPRDLLGLMISSH